MRLSDEQQQACWDLYDRFCTLTGDIEQMLQDIEQMLRPKKHVFVKLFCDMCQKGNPRYYANWRDEGLNKLLRSACRQLSQATFEPTLLVHMEFLLRDEAKGGRKRVREVG